MTKNILKKITFIFSLVFVLSVFNFVFAAPIVTLGGKPSVDLTLGSVFVDSGATATDEAGAPLEVKVSGSVDVNTVGTYIISYEATNASGISSVSRTVNVIPLEPTPPTPVTPPAPTYHDIVVKDNCTVTDTDGVSHVFPVEGSTSKFLGVCALVAAKEAGYINSFDLVNDPSMGLYLKNINATILGSSEYWALWLNRGFASCGIGCLPVLVGDKLDLVLTDWVTSTESTKILLKISSLESTPPTPVTPPAPTGGTGGSGSSAVSDKEFSIEDAFSFLIKNKKSDGSYGDSMYTDWVAIAAAAGNNSSIKSGLVNYLKSNEVSSSIVTDYERRAMALMALGINPYSGTDIDYIRKITESFDGVQFGDSSLENDDIFALIVLKNAGYSLSDEIIKKDIDYVISKQSPSGSWGSIDMTAAGIQALKVFESASGVSNSISKAESFLITNQKTDGGFENSFSTSWALQVLNDDSQISKGKLYLSEKQQSDGGMENTTDDIDTRVWSTSYAVPAILHKTWDQILKDFSKPVVSEVVVSSKNEEIINDTSILSVAVLEKEKIEVQLEEKKEDKSLSVLGEKIKIKESSNPRILENKDIKKIDLIEEGNSEKGIDLAKGNTFLRVLNGVWSAVKSPFIWLLIKLGF